jgi:HK97 family phage prohead protease
MSVTRETRFLTSTELRAGGGTGKNDAPPFIEGYSAVFSKSSQNLGGFKERIKPGTFARALREKQDVRFLFNHSADCGVLGRVKSGTLRLNEDAHGLFFHCDLPDTQQARDLHTSISRGDLDACSFAFQVVPGGESWAEEEDEDEENGGFIAMRTLSDVDLADSSVVVWPAYTQTSVSARAGSGKHEQRNMENKTMQNFSDEQRHFLSGKCAAGFEEISPACPSELRNKIIEIRAARLGVKPAGPAPQATDNELQAKLRALNSLS